eukprot:413710-Prymnesium_polylepis.1
MSSDCRRRAPTLACRRRTSAPSSRSRPRAPRAPHRCGTGRATCAWWTAVARRRAHAVALCCATRAPIHATTTRT